MDAFRVAGIERRLLYMHSDKCSTLYNKGRDDLPRRTTAADLRAYGKSGRGEVRGCRARDLEETGSGVNEQAGEGVPMQAVQLGWAHFIAMSRMISWSQWGQRLKGAPCIRHRQTQDETGREGAGAQVEADALRGRDKGTILTACHRIKRAAAAAAEVEGSICQDI